LTYQPPTSSTFLSEQTSHQQPDNNTFLREQITTSHEPNESDWRIKHYIQGTSANLIGSISRIFFLITISRIYKTRRTQYQMADMLAEQTLASIQSKESSFLFSGLRTNPNHVNGCPLLMALQFVTMHNVMFYQFLVVRASLRVYFFS
jgi:hypothetical protein